MSPIAIVVELRVEQMIASSMKVSDKHVDTQLSNKKDMWGKQNVWE